MNLGHGMGILAGTLFGSIVSWKAVRFQAPTAPSGVSFAGRDQALVRLIQEARRSIYLRTEDLTLVPAGNELAQAVQRMVAVTVELPLAACVSPVDARMPRILMDLGAVVTFRSESAGNYRGAYLEIDGERFLYSASPLTMNPPGSQVSFVVGPIHRLE